MVKHFVGARFVPKIASPVERAANTSYEALTIVTFDIAYYISKVPVTPTVGNPANNPQYWALTELRGDLTELSKSVDASAQAAAKSASDADASAQAAADSAAEAKEYAREATMLEKMVSNAYLMGRTG